MSNCKNKQIDRDSLHLSDKEYWLEQFCGVLIQVKTMKQVKCFSRDLRRKQIKMLTKILRRQEAEKVIDLRRFDIVIQRMRNSKERG